MRLWKRNEGEKNRLDDACKRLPEGSAEAFRFLFEKYRNSIYRFCYKMLWDEEAAEDAFQETFIKVFENRTKFRGDNFQAWVYKIAKNVCLNMIKKRREDVVFNEDYINPYEDVNYEFNLDFVIKEAIDKLPESLKEAFILKEYEQLKYKDIAEILHIEENAAKVKVHRAKVKLREFLEPFVREFSNA